MKKSILLIALGITTLCYSQNSTFETVANSNKATMKLDNDSFAGEGWNQLISKAQASNHVLIGEIHFTREIPQLCNALIDAISFDNLIVEVDQYSSEIIASAIANLDQTELKSFQNNYKHLFSFYSNRAEYEFLSNSIGKGINLIGSDQIVLYTDQLVFTELIEITKIDKAKEIYTEMKNKSAEFLEGFLQNPQGPLYMVIPEYSEKLNELEKLELSDEEAEIISALKKSVSIYTKEGHNARIQLIKNGLIESLNKWSESKNLFKYGAMHMARGLSFLGTYDVGNLVTNIADSQFASSLHILMVGKSGFQGAPFDTFPAAPINLKVGPFNSIKPLADLANSDGWTIFNMEKIRNELQQQGGTPQDIILKRVINGYDLVIVIPEVSAADF